jgi:hypothetical protein
MQNVFLAIFALIWSAITLVMNVSIAHDVGRQFDSRHFPSVDGIVTHSEVAIHHGSKGRISYSADIEYSFKLGRIHYNGSRLRFNNSTQGSGENQAQVLVDAHPAGSSVPVYYDPHNPEESLLFPGITGMEFFPGLFLTPFNCIMLGFLFWLGGSLRELIFHPVAGGVKIFSDGLNTHVRLPQLSVFYWGLLTTGGMAFVSIFIVGFSTGMQPSIPLAVASLVLVYLAGLATALWQWFKIRQGVDDLLINDTAGTLELPLTFGRKERLTIRFGAVESVFVEQIVHRSSKGGISYTYAPTLQLRGGEPSQHKLADWGDRRRADDLADWLRRQLRLETATG